MVSVCQFSETELEAMQKLDVGDEQVVNQRNQYLRHYSIFAGSKKALDLEILLHPFEEDFDLPTLFVNSGNA